MVVGDDEPRPVSPSRPGDGEPVRVRGTARRRHRVRPVHGRPERGGLVLDRAARSGAGARARPGRGRRRAPRRPPPRRSRPRRAGARAARRSSPAAPRPDSPSPAVAATSAATPPRGSRQRGGRRRGPDGLLPGGRVLGEEPHQPAAAALVLAGRGGLLLRVALGRLGGELVDVGEDRAAERVDRVGLQAAGDARLDEPPPGEAGADAVGGEQRVEAAARLELPAPELDVGAARARRVGVGRGEQVEEAVERDLDADPHGLPELALERPRVARAPRARSRRSSPRPAPAARAGAPRPPPAAPPRRGDRWSSLSRGYRSASDADTRGHAA